jgi:dipeptidyl aminopeptidase/acylaminoacyl peptidase
MKSFLFSVWAVSTTITAFAQKKPLDHSVYDSWQSLGDVKITRNGQWVVYNVNVQEGDNELVVQRTDATMKQVYARGYNPSISYDSRFIIFLIKPYYTDIRQARIKKKKPDDMPKDSLAILDLQTMSLFKTGRVKSFGIPEKAAGWVAYHKEKAVRDSTPFLKMDSVMKSIDTPRVAPAKNLPLEPEKKKRKRKDSDDEWASDGFAEDDASPAGTGTNLIVRNLLTGAELVFPDVAEYLWSKKGNILVAESSPADKKKKIPASVFVWRSIENRSDTIIKGGNDFKNIVIDENGYQVAFVAERDSSVKSLQKFYKLWFWQNGDDSARVVADRNTTGMPLNWTVSENGRPSFSKSGKRLFFGTAPVKPAKDTTLPEIDIVKVDIWHYNDEYLQPQQLRNLDNELKRSYTALHEIGSSSIVQLGDISLPQIILTNEGDGDQVVGITDKGNRVAAQWEGTTKKDIYTINPLNGEKKLVRGGLYGSVEVSPTGKYIVWYDSKARHFFSWINGTATNITAALPVKIYDEENDMPADPSPYGIFRWLEKDDALFLYDRYDIWQIDPQGKQKPIAITNGRGRKTNTVYRYVSTNREERFLTVGQQVLLRIRNEKTKDAGWATYKLFSKMEPVTVQSAAFAYGVPVKAEEANVYCYSKESFQLSPDLYSSTDLQNELKLSATNPQQKDYSWGTASLFTWKAYNGKEATGIVYKPENFDPKKKYPMIAYFYETLSDGLNNYLPPSPTPSRLNIPFFVSRGYIVLAPDIYYDKGYPGRSAYNYVVSGARALVKKGWVDSTRMGIQGQSWGGYQVAHIITRTTLFKAAWAGAPVANMTSAYGGIRWESGLNRQFQYEKSQSRIGATLWEKPQLYIENSPLFHLAKVKTPLVIMANDQDGAVPWYQGIEMFTAMRRLGKKVWMLNYNGEAHNLVERKNRKDISIREQQFFDWLLKDEKPTKWLSEGVPAVLKGIERGIE